MDASEIDQELEALGSKAEQLRALYEQYFMGIERIEPLVMRKDVERRVRVLRREQLRNTAQRFKFNTLVQRFNTMSTHWARVVREIENGTYRRDVLRAAARFGEGALTALGKKKTKELIAAVASAQQKRPADDAFELEAEDLIEEDDETDAPTPPRLAVTMGAPLGAAPSSALSTPTPAGLGQGDLPVVGTFQPVTLGETPKPTLPQAAPPPKQVAGLRWGGSAPLANAATPVRPAAEVTRRVADLAAQLGASRSAPGRAGGAGFGELDLDFDEPPAGRSTVDAPPPRSVPAPVASKPPGTPAASPPANRSVTAARPPALSNAPAGRDGGHPQPPGAELPDQRIRQIYAKYVETKRSTQESTAGVTFEKLASSLRAQADKLKSAHPNKSIDYEVVVKDGKTHLKPVLR
jgi:hypothetical protein